MPSVAAISNTTAISLHPITIGGYRKHIHSIQVQPVQPKEGKLDLFSPDKMKNSRFKSYLRERFLNALQSLTLFWAGLLEEVLKFLPTANAQL